MSEFPKAPTHTCWTGGRPPPAPGSLRGGRRPPGPADVVPDRGPIGAGGSRIDVVAEELRGQVVLAAAPGIAPGLRWTSLKAPTVPAATSACLTTPTRFRGEEVSLRNGVVKALYTTQTSV